MTFILDQPMRYYDRLSKTEQKYERKYKYKYKKLIIPVIGMMKSCALH